MPTRVLIVDDEPLIADSLGAFLEDEGMEVISVGSGEIALHLADCGTIFDVCVMDMRLPGVDGDNAIRRLAAICPTLKFIVHTGSLDYILTDELRCLGLREEYLFRKPVHDMAIVANAVKRLVE